VSGGRHPPASLPSSRRAAGDGATAAVFGRLLPSRPGSVMRKPFTPSDSTNLRHLGIFLGDDRVSSAASKPVPLLHREDPDRAALRHLRILAWEDRFIRDCIFAGFDAQPDWTLCTACRRPGNETRTAATPDPVGIPNDLPGPRRRRAELAVVGAAGRTEAPPAGASTDPSERRAICVRPHLLAGVEIPRLHSRCDRRRRPSSSRSSRTPM